MTVYIYIYTVYLITQITILSKTEYIPSNFVTSYNFQTWFCKNATPTFSYGSVSQWPVAKNHRELIVWNLVTPLWDSTVIWLCRVIVQGNVIKCVYRRLALGSEQLKNKSKRVNEDAGHPTVFHMFPHVSTCQGPHIGHRSFPKEVRASHSPPFAVKKPTPRVGMVLLPCPVAAWSWSRWVCLPKNLSRPYQTIIPLSFLGRSSWIPISPEKNMFGMEHLGMMFPTLRQDLKHSRKNQSCHSRVPQPGP